MARQRLDYEELVNKLSEKRHIHWLKLINDDYDLKELMFVAQLKNEFSLATKTEAAMRRLCKE